MLDQSEKISFLSQGVFESLGDEVIAQIAARAGERGFSSGECLFLQGEPGDEVFFIISGDVEVVRDGQVISVLGPGDVIGEMAILGETVRSATGRAKGEVETLFLMKKAVRLLVSQIPELAFKLFKVLVERLEKTDELLSLLSKPPALSAEITVTLPDGSTRSCPMRGNRRVIGRARGALVEDGLRLAIDTDSERLLYSHALLSLIEGRLFIEPLDGAVSVDGQEIGGPVEISEGSRIELADLKLNIKPFREDA